ncbi:MAG: alpha/beta fold hydrolase [Desulfococcaceae bacterium]
MTPPITDCFRARDGARLRFGIWPARSGSPRGGVWMLPGRSEFLEKYAETAEALCRRNFAVYGLDWRGQGLSARPLRDRFKGHVDDYGTYLDDLDRFAEEVRDSVPFPRLILGHSMGAHMALRWLAERPEVASAAVLTSPMIDIYAGPWPPAVARRLTAAALARGRSEEFALGEGPYRPKTEERFRRNVLTSDRDRYLAETAMIARNPALALGGVTWGWVAATYASVDRLRDPAIAARIRAPVLMVTAGRDRVVPAHAQKALCRALPRCRLEVLPEARHEILRERDAIRAEFWAHFDDWVGKVLEK